MSQAENKSVLTAELKITFQANNAQELRTLVLSIFEPGLTLSQNAELTADANKLRGAATELQHAVDHAPKPTQ